MRPRGRNAVEARNQSVLERPVIEYFRKIVIRSSKKDERENRFTH